MNTNEQICIALILILIFFCVKDTVLLRQKGWVLYYTPSCPYCVQQLGEFGWKSALLNKVNCEESKCPGVQAYPTWVNSKTGAKIEGVITKDKIAEKLLL